EDAIRVMNEDYRKMNPDTGTIIPEFKGIAADTRIEFRLAKIDPDGNCTEGITRTASKKTYLAGENVKQVALSWPRAMYLNVWVVHSISSGAAGYSYYPGTVNDGRDGIVILHSYVGSIGTSSVSHARTMTHEIGHYLNLPHPWGSTNDPELPFNCHIDDGIDDTPLTVGHTSCNLYAQSCGSLDNVQNYMDYSYCGRMFTYGQMHVMRAALNSDISDRNHLWSPENLIATGTYDGYPDIVCHPITDFKYTADQGCRGFSVVFTDLTYNTDTITSWLWECPGGNPMTSSEQNPVIVYPDTGTYSVSLTVSNPGGTDFKIIDTAIRVYDPDTGRPAPLNEGFEDPEFPYAIAPFLKWHIEGEGDFTWERTTTASYTGMAGLRLNNMANQRGSKSEMITPVIMLDTAGLFKYVTFRLAYARKDDHSDEELNIYASVDCGETWHLRYNKIATLLSTTQGTYYTTPFIPDAGQWKEQSFNLGPYGTGATLMLKFECFSDGGNWLYIDDILIEDETGIDNPDAEKIINLEIRPNPFMHDMTFYFDVPEKSEVVIEIRNLLGEVIAFEKSNMDAGMKTRRLKDFIPVPEKGMYLISVNAGGIKVTKRAVCL
ncbi:MAG: M43 family zinc metalloprotease, partial [Bacteroidota bacterium]